MAESRTVQQLKQEATELGLAGEQLFKYVKEEGDKQRAERLEARRMALEKDRIEAEEADRKFKLEMEKDRIAAEEAERKDRLVIEEAERKARAEAEEADRKFKLEMEKDRIAAAEAERKDRLAAAEAERRDRLAAEEAERKDRLVIEEAERKERLAAEEASKTEQLEWEKQEKEAERNYKHEIEMRKLDLEQKRIEAGLGPSSEGHDQGSAAHEAEHRLGMKRGPKLPYFAEGRDQIDAYLFRFEQYAEVQRWPREHWASYLGSLLQGKALEVYYRLPAEQLHDYDKVAEALLKRFDITEEALRKKVKDCRPEKGETFAQFGDRLRHYHDKWIELGRVERTFESLQDFLLRDQFLQACGRELATFLRERAIDKFETMTKQADRFAEIRGGAHSVANRTSKSSDALRTSTGHEKSIVNNTQGGIRSNAPTCYICSRVGHIARNCLSEKARRTSVAACVAERDRFDEPSCSSSGLRGRGRGQSYPRMRNGRGYRRGYLNACVLERVVEQGTLGGVATGNCNAGLEVRPGMVNGIMVEVMRDSGCTGVIVRRSLVGQKQMLGRVVECRLINGQKLITPVARIMIDTPFFRGTVDAWCIDDPLYDLIVGNIPGVQEVDRSESKSMAQEEDTAQAVITRAQAKVSREGQKPLIVTKLQGIDKTPGQIREMQMSDSTLRKIRDQAEQEVAREVKSGGQAKWVWKAGVLNRQFVGEDGQKYHQIIVPSGLRETVMKLGHETMMAGHLGTRRTISRVLSEFYWPGCQTEIRRFCSSCDICQRTIPKGRVSRVPLGRMPLISTPFERVAVDLIGPIIPASDRGNRFILVMVDYATRYPEAVALKNIDTETVAEALVEMFSRVGVPKEVLSDRGSQFTSGMMTEVHRLLSVKSLLTTPYHPMANGLVERFNATLKSMLKKLSVERPRDWDRYIGPALFAYREVPQESLGFAPFELLYGRTVRGPMTILRELWSKEIEDPELVSTYQYVLDLRQRIEDTCQLAQDNLREAAKYYKKVYDAKTKDRNFSVGQKVLVLLPTNTSKLLMQWKGPFEIIEVKGLMDYTIRMDGKFKTFHANMLKLYQEREIIAGMMAEDMLGRELECFNVEVDQQEQEACALVLDLPDNESEDDTSRIESIEQRIEGIEPLTCPIEAKETYSDVIIAETLTGAQRREVEQLVSEFRDVFSDVPAITTLAEIDIKLTTTVPVRSSRQTPIHMIDQVTKEVREMERLGIIEHSKSPYASPLILVKKKDGGIRTCVDLRALNKITVFDSEPMPDIEQIFAKMGSEEKKYYTKIDLAKGYWQIPLREEAKEKTAFITPIGLFQFRVMCFGLVTAPAVFSRMMRKLLEGMVDIDNFIDDIMIFSETWNEHLGTLRELLERLRKYKLRARPTKCVVGAEEIDCLGHKIGKGGLAMMPDKIEAIRDAPTPVSKRQVRAFLGLVGFYRKFIEGFSSIAAPLTDLTKKGEANRVKWLQKHQEAFQKLKDVVVKKPILQTVEMSRKFTLRTDASDLGLGAVLLQPNSGDGMTLHPVAYASKKLSPRETRYSVIERECLAIVWGVNKFQKYLYGRDFTIQTDHHPLRYLNTAKLSNGRLMRWALLLQPYYFTIQHIKGTDNVGADYLSRVEESEDN